MSDLADLQLRVSVARGTVEAAALESITTHHYDRADDPNAAAYRQAAAQTLALAARDLVRAVDALPEDERPAGWAEGLWL